MKKIMKGLMTSIFTIGLLIPASQTAYASTFTIPAGIIEGTRVQDYIDSANSGDKIVFDANTIINGGFTIDKSLTLEGNGAKLYMNNGSRGNSSFEWGGILIDAYDEDDYYYNYNKGKVVVDGFDITGYDITSTKYGYRSAGFQEGSVNIMITSGKNITISNNILRVGKYIDGKTSPRTESIVCVGVGVGAYYDEDISNVTITKNKFLPNSSSIGFQGFYINSGASNVKIDNNSFNGNFSRHSFSEGSSITISNNNFSSGHNITGLTSAEKGLPLSIAGNNNMIMNNSFSSTTNQYCIQLERRAKNAHIVDNTFVTIPANQNSNLATYGIKNDNMVGIITQAGATFLNNEASYAKNDNAYSTNISGIVYLYKKISSTISPSGSGSGSSQPIFTYVPPYQDTTTDPYVYQTNTTNTTSAVANTTAAPVATRDAVIIANNVTIKAGTRFNIMTGVRAYDDGGDGKGLTNKVTTKGSINTAKEGVYSITYRVTGANGKTVTKRRIVTVKAKA